VADLLIRGGTVVTPSGSFEGSVYVDGTRIAAIGDGPSTAATVIDAEGGLVLPGFVQAHVHLCQTLFRGLAADLDVIDWLRTRVWPLEQAHDASSLSASAALGVAELLLGGTTTVLSMETTRHTDAVLQVAADLGIRARVGPALMDRVEPGTEMEGSETAAVMESVSALVDEWEGACDGRLGVAVSPRGPRNATPELWAAAVALAGSRGLVIHTHVDENRAQARRMARQPGGRDVCALDAWGALGPRTVMAHCVWLSDAELALVRSRGAHVCHCPSANLKLASGVAPIPSYREMGINVALGADGAACNDNLSAFTEMRLAALIHKPRYGPTAMPAGEVLDMATMGGARALGLADEIGSIAVGKRADLVVVDRRGLHGRPAAGSTPSAAIVYALGAGDVSDVVVDGRVVVRDGRLTTASEAVIAADAERQRRALIDRAFGPSGPAAPSAPTGRSSPAGPTSG
jgi:5-methylthioadenosine/S-adenosylhomocysteine deaminase